MQITINSKKASSLFLNGTFYETNKPLEVSFSEALRLSRIAATDLESTIQAYNPDLFNKEKRFALLADIDSFSGWGNAGIGLIKYSTPKYDISQIGRLHDVTDGAILRAAKNTLDPHMGLVIHEQPKYEWISSPFERKIAIVPFETTRCPASWVSRINACHALFVPCKQNIDCFRDSGVTVPIELIHWGIDGSKFHEVEKMSGRPFTFGTMGALSNRKGTDILMDAFVRAFPTEKDVQLVCKTSNYNFIGAVKDKRVKIDLTPVTHDELMQGFFRQVDCFVFPTRGEGFGFTPLEAMACGIPAMVTGWSGPADFMNEEVGWSIEHKMVPAKDFSENVYREDCGDWAEPNVDHLIALMRHAYKNQDEVRAKGKVAAEYVKNNWQWSQQIHLFHEAIEKHLSK